MSLTDRSDGADELDTYARPSWQLHAACRGLGPDLFFDDRGEIGYRAARKVCADCPVRAECLDHALAAPVEKFGLWGGLTERERRRLRRRRKVQRS